MKIAVFCKMPVYKYSGGRTHPYILGRCLAMEGNDVLFVFDTIPVFISDFRYWKGVERTRHLVSRDFAVKDAGKLGKYDYAVLAPMAEYDRTLVNNFLYFTEKTGAIPVVINYETPNWFNSFVPDGRNIKSHLYLGKILRKYRGILLSSDLEGERFAKEYYGESDTIKYRVWNPPINSIEADRAGNSRKDKMIFCGVRLSDRHKGGQDLLNVLSQDLRGFTVVFMTGLFGGDRKYFGKLKRLSDKYGFRLRVLRNPSDLKKYKELKRSMLLLFPTRFEGFGTPPVEARYCGALCITYDLPVLREINGNEAVYSNYGDDRDLKRKLREQIRLINAGKFKQVYSDKAHLSCVSAAGVLNSMLLTEKEGYTCTEDHCKHRIVHERQLKSVLKGYIKLVIGYCRKLRFGLA